MFDLDWAMNRIWCVAIMCWSLSSTTAHAYRFEIIAEPGDVIEDRTITHFSPEDNPIAINNNREIVFMASVDGFDNYAIMTPERFIAGAGKVVDGVMPTFLQEDHRLSINDAGQVVYKGILDDSVGDVFGGGAIFINDKIVAGIGHLIDGRTITSVEIRPVINNEGTVAFVATYEGHDNSALFTQYALVAERGFPVDESRVLEGGIFLPQIHDDGTIAFSGGIAGQNNVLILTQDGLLVESGETMPGSTFIVNDVIDGRVIAGDIKSFGISDAGEVAFWAIISSAEGSILGQGLFTQNRLLVESGDNLDGHIVSSIFGGGRQFNSSGTFSFIADIVDIGEGLWVGHVLALASGHTIDGRIVDELHHIVGLNDRGDVALLVRFTDGDSAIVLGIVPEPSTVVLCAIGVSLFLIERVKSKYPSPSSGVEFPDSDLQKSAARGRPVRYAVVTVILSLGHLDTAGALIIDKDTTLDSRILPRDGPVDIVDGLNPPTTVEIIDGAEISPSIRVRGQSVLNIRGGITHSFVIGFDKSVINVFDGLVASGEDVEANDNSLLNILGGTFGDDVRARASGTVNLHGGSFEKTGDGATLFVQHDGIINVFGTRFRLTPEGQVFERLTGILSDGSPIDVQIEVDQFELGDARVVLHTVPEPISLTAACVALAIIATYVMRQAIS